MCIPVTEALNRYRNQYRFIKRITAVSIHWAGTCFLYYDMLDIQNSAITIRMTLRRTMSCISFVPWRVSEVHFEFRVLRGSLDSHMQSLGHSA